MKVVDITVLRSITNGEDPIPLCSATDLSAYGYFQRQGVKEMISFFTKTISKRTELGQRQSITHESYVIHCYTRSDGLAGTVTTDLEYPSRVAFVLLTQLLDEFTSALGNAWKGSTVHDSVSFPRMEEYLVQYQDPAAADKVSKIQKDLEDTMQVLHKTIDSVFERGVGWYFGGKKRYSQYAE